MRISPGCDILICCVSASLGEWDVLDSASGEGTRLPPGVVLGGADEALLSFSLPTERMALEKGTLG